MSTKHASTPSRDASGESALGPKATGTAQSPHVQLAESMQTWKPFERIQGSQNGYQWWVTGPEAVTTIAGCDSGPGVTAHSLRGACVLTGHLAPPFMRMPDAAGCMYDRILVPTDGSDHSNTAAEHAMELAEQFGAMIHALFVVEQTGPSGHWDLEVEKQETAGERALDAVVALGEERGVHVERHLRRGAPSEEIVDAATDYGVGLIVMGTQGRTGIARIATAGSTTERVVRLTDIPTLVVGGAGAGDA